MTGALFTRNYRSVATRTSAPIGDVKKRKETFHTMTETREPERNEEAQQERDWITLGRLEDQQQKQLVDIDAAIARIKAGNNGICINCGQAIEEGRLRAVPATDVCACCVQSSDVVQSRSDGDTSEAEKTANPPRSGRLLAVLDQLDDDELAAELLDTIREDGQVDTEELQIHTRNGIVYLEGAVPSEPEHEILRAILTDVAGVQEIVD